MAKAKGTVLVGMVKFLRKNRDLAQRVLAPEYHHYLEAQIMDAVW